MRNVQIHVDTIWIERYNTRSSATSMQVNNFKLLRSLHVELLLAGPFAVENRKSRGMAKLPSPTFPHIHLHRKNSCCPLLLPFFIRKYLAVVLLLPTSLCATKDRHRDLSLSTS
jgi:hypothetical protein